MLHWNTAHLHGACVCFDPCDKTKIDLRTKGRFAVSFAVNVKAKSCCECDAAISLQMISKHHRADIYTVYSRVPHSDTPVTISMGGIIIEVPDFHAPASIFLKLVSSDSLIVEDSMLSIIEI